MPAPILAEELIDLPELIIGARQIAARIKFGDFLEFIIQGKGLFSDQRHLLEARDEFVKNAAFRPQLLVADGYALVIIGIDNLARGNLVQRISGALMAIAHVHGYDPGFFGKFCRHMKLNNLKIRGKVDKQIFFY